MGLLKTLQNRLRIGAKKASAALKDHEGEFELAIEDSKNQIADFQTKIVRLNAHQKSLQTQKTGLNTKVKNFGIVAEKAVEAGNDDDATKALELQTEIENQLSTIETQLTGNSKNIDAARNQVKAHKQRIKDAEMSKESLSMRKQSAELKTDLAKSNSSLQSGDDPLAKLNDFEKKVADMEATADAMDEEVSLEADNSGATLDAKYNSGVSSAEDKLAALKAKKKTPAKKTTK